MTHIIIIIIIFLLGGIGGIIQIIRKILHTTKKTVINTKRNYKIGRRYNDPVKIDNELFEKVISRYGKQSIPHFHKITIANFIIRSEIMKAPNKLQVFARILITFNNDIIVVKYWWDYVEETKNFINRIASYFEEYCNKIKFINQDHNDETYFRSTLKTFENQSRKFAKVLGVPYRSDIEVIKTAYRRLAKKYHPDLNRDNQVIAEEKMKAINEAYTFLKTELSMKH